MIRMIIGIAAITFAVKFGILWALVLCLAVGGICGWFWDAPNKHCKDRP
jgi:hypothetical protein